MANDIYTFLGSQNIDYKEAKHPAVFTEEEARRLVPKLPGMAIKNLLVKDKSGRFFLMVVAGEKKVDLKALGEKLGVKKLRFASPEQLQEHLGVEPGSVTLLGVLNDNENVVEVILDENVWQAEALQCHPLVNTATLSISHAGIEQFFKATGHEPKIIGIPGQPAE